MTRTRNYTFVVYPDSAPAGWISILDSFHVPSFISPLHDSDLLPDGTGEVKKAHYHVIVMFDSVKTLEQARELAIQCGSANDVVFPCQSIRGMARYLCHLDNPDKYQYPVDMVTCLSGADYYQIIDLPSSRYAVISEMMQYVLDNKIDSFAHLCEVARGSREDWFRILCDSGAYIMKEYIKSHFWAIRNNL